MDLESLITGIKPIKNKPIERIPFDKKAPIHEHNFPMSKYTIYRIHGGKRRANGIGYEPFWFNKQVATGVKITAQLFGLDKIFTIDAIKQVY